MSGGLTQMRRWAEPITEVVIILLSIYYVLTNQLWALLTWEAVTLIYLGCGLALVWDGQHEQELTAEARRSFAWWSWLVPLLCSVMGINSAVVALIAQKQRGDHSAMLAAVASLGVVLSWTMLQVGFAHIYRALDSEKQRGSIRFPDGVNPSFVDYLYFSFTLGTSFATSDREVVGLPVRRVVLIHSVLSFFYNAVVVAVAFQVLQELMPSA